MSPVKRKYKEDFFVVFLLSGGCFSAAFFRGAFMKPLLNVAHDRKNIYFYCSHWPV